MEYKEIGRIKIIEMILDILKSNKHGLSLKEITWKLWERDIEDIEYQQTGFLLKLLLKDDRVYLMKNNYVART